MVTYDLATSLASLCLNPLRDLPVNSPWHPGMADPAASETSDVAASIQRRVGVALQRSSDPRSFIRWMGILN